MEKIGSINKLFNALDGAYATHKKASDSKESIANALDIKSVASIIRSIGKAGDLGLILDSERVILRHELEFYGKNNNQAFKSIKEAIKEVDGAFKALAIVCDKEKYSIVNDSHSPKDRDRKDGLPKDAFHVFTNSHKTRLSNRIRTIETSAEERLLLTERYINMKTAQKEYMLLQSNTLNIPIPEKSKEQTK